MKRESKVEESRVEDISSPMDPRIHRTDLVRLGTARDKPGDIKSLRSPSPY